MKNCTALTASLALALAMTSATLPAAAHAAPGGSSAVAKACNGGLAEQLNISVGTCIQYFRDLDAVGICKLLKDADALDFFNYRNQGQCIKALS